MRLGAVKDERHGPGYVVQHLAGKLVGLRLGEVRSIVDLGQVSAAFRVVADSIPGPMVVCVDCRRMQIVSGQVADALLVALQHNNAKLHRSALLMPSDARIVRLQIERLLSEARNPGRRICEDGPEVKAWLASSLDPRERDVLSDFLGAPGL